MSVASAAGPLDATVSSRATARTAERIDVVRGLAAAEAIWRGFEATAAMSPYGRYDWCASYVRGLGIPDDAVRVAVGRAPGGELSFLLPVHVRGRFGFTVAEAIGGKHSNLNMPLTRPGFLPGSSPAAARQLLRSAGRALGADLLLLPHVPAAWDGLPNPFAASGQPSPSNSWSLRLEPDPEAVLARSMSADARKKLRNKTRQLEREGTVRVLRAGTEAEVDLILEAFLRQKEERFGELGIHDPFAEDGVRDFMRRAALAGLAKGRPAIELYGLLVGDEVVAVLGGAADERRFSGMVLSFQAGAFARFSPGEMLVTRVIRLLCQEGRASFDLGVGEARYKRSICDCEDALVDVALPISVQARAVALGRIGMVSLKRRLKASPAAMTALARLRRTRAALRA